MAENTGKTVSIDHSEVHSISNDSINQSYLLNILTPPGYDPEGEPYPVLYLTDGSGNFTALTSFTPLMQTFGELKRFITVGITYDVEVAMHSMTLRSRDVTQTDAPMGIAGAQPEWMKELPQVGTGGAAEFLRFINEGIKPYVESQFNADPSDSCYAGFSLGGLFGLHCLFSQPASFQRYVIGSPSIWWDDRDILNAEKIYAENNSDLAARVFMSSGELEEPEDKPDESAMVTNMLNLAETLQQRNYPSLKLDHTVLAAETHLSAVGATLMRGVRSVFA